MSDTWPDREVGSAIELLHLLQYDAGQGQSNLRPLAWRGMACADWPMRCSLDRMLRRVGHDADHIQCLRVEHELLRRFRWDALPFATDTERQFLMTLDGPGIWDAMALGQHCGMPTRLLDWTRSPWVAAYFACIHNQGCDGALWWFDQVRLEDVLRKNWDAWGVPTHADSPAFPGLTPEVAGRLGLNERALHATAFAEDGAPWITKIHHRFTFPRLEAQQGFVTAAGRLCLDHNEAIDAMPGSEAIRRGRVIIKAAAKQDVVSLLLTLNVDARSLLYPGIDIVARRLAAEFDMSPG